MAEAILKALEVFMKLLDSRKLSKMHIYVKLSLKCPDILFGKMNGYSHIPLHNLLYSINAT